MSAPAEIRELRYADLPRAIAIERRVFPAPWSLAMFALELSKPGGINLAAEAGSELVAYCVCSRYETVWHVMNICVGTIPANRQVAPDHEAACHLLDLPQKER